MDKNDKYGDLLAPKSSSTVSVVVDPKRENGFAYGGDFDYYGDGTPYGYYYQYGEVSEVRKRKKKPYKRKKEDKKKRKKKKDKKDNNDLDFRWTRVDIEDNPILIYPLLPGASYPSEIKASRQIGGRLGGPPTKGTNAQQKSLPMIEICGSRKIYF